MDQDEIVLRSIVDRLTAWPRPEFYEVEYYDQDQPQYHHIAKYRFGAIPGPGITAVIKRYSGGYLCWLHYHNGAFAISRQPGAEELSFDPSSFILDNFFTSQGWSFDLADPDSFAQIEACFRKLVR